MSDVIANVIVGIAIAASACYAIWRLGPRRMRDSLRLRLSRTFPTLCRNLAVPASGGCDACGGCSMANAKPAPKQPRS